ncbi:MAG: hypothetical protein HFJ85_05940 [Oscillospiraceae bacterium]|nr:hypothetical protein [Oscillospiraceae bacterium]
MSSNGERRIYILLANGPNHSCNGCKFHHTAAKPAYFKGQKYFFKASLFTFPGSACYNLGKNSLLNIGPLNQAAEKVLIKNRYRSFQNGIYRQLVISKDFHPQASIEITPCFNLSALIFRINQGGRNKLNQDGPSSFFESRCFQ